MVVDEPSPKSEKHKRGIEEDNLYHYFFTTMYTQITELFSHPDVAITQLFQHYWLWIYSLMFIEYFLESAFVSLSFLPWDWLLVMIWVLSLKVVWDDITWSIDIDMVFKTMLIAWFLGDMINYFIGKKVWSTIIWKQVTLLGRSFILVKHSSIDKAKELLSTYGYKTFLYSRILPVFRNIMPLVAWILHSDIKRFLIFDTIWLIVLIWWELSLWMIFGKIPWVANHLSLIIILFVSIILCGTILWKKILSQLSK